MALRYYDDILVEKISKWIPQTSPLRVLKADESKRLFELHADDTNDKPFKLPLIAISRNKDLALRSNIKQSKSFDGLKAGGNEHVTVHMNVIPVLVTYQLDIFTKTYEEGDEYVRNFLFKLINNPKLIVDIPYNDAMLRHTANIRVLDSVSDTSDISEHLFPGQFTRWTIQLELQDAFLFSVPYKNNWHFVDMEVEAAGVDPEVIKEAQGGFEITNDLAVEGDIENIGIAGPIKI